MTLNVFALLWQIQRLGFVAQMATLPLRDDTGASRLPFQVMIFPLLYFALRPHCPWAFYIGGMCTMTATLLRYVTNGVNSGVVYLLFVEALFLVRCTPTIILMRKRKNEKVNETKQNWHQLVLNDISKCSRDSATLLYFLSGLHKMNSDYFEPAKGCAFTMIAGNLALYTPSLLKYTHHLGWAASIGSVVLEFGHPVMTMYARWNEFEVALMTVFHLAINTPAPYGAPTFTYVMLHILCICNLDVYDEICSLLRSIWASMTLVGKTNVSSLTLSLSVVIIGVGLAANISYDEGIEFTVMVYNFIGALLIFIGAYLKRSRGSSNKRIERSSSGGQIQTSSSSINHHGLLNRAMYIIVLLLMFLHGLQPYFGLSTVGVFSMYSNLQPYVSKSSGEANRHFFMPRLSSQLQGHHIKVLESTSSTFLCAAIQQDKPEIRDMLHDIGINSKFVYTPLMFFHRIAIGNSYEDCHYYDRTAEMVFKPYTMTQSQFMRLALAKRSDDSPSTVKYQDMSTGDVHVLSLPVTDYDMNETFDIMLETFQIQSMAYTFPFYGEEPTLCYTA